MLTATTNNWSNCTVLCVKKGRIIEKDKLIFFHDNAPSHTSTMVQNYLDTQLGSATLSRLLTRPGIFWLSSVFVDGPCARWAALRFLWRRPAWWVVCLERWGIFLAWYTQIARKMGKIYSLREQVLCFCFLGKKNVFFDLKTADLSLYTW